MTSNGKLWVLRLASIPALLYLPAACLGIADWLGGSRYPTGESFMAGLVGMAIVICLLPWQNAVTGFILDDRGTQLNISESVVSGNQLNVHCAEGFA